MSNLKFRAFHKIRKEMYRVHGWHSEFVFKDTLDGVGNDGNPDRLVDVELMQFTGLTDKNGKEIYEGDILTYQDGTGSNKVVEYSDKYGHFKCKFYKGGGFIDTLFYYIERQCEVIGNIYENIELLK